MIGKLNEFERLNIVECYKERKVQPKRIKRDKNKIFPLISNQRAIVI